MSSDKDGRMSLPAHHSSPIPYSFRKEMIMRRAFSLRWAALLAGALFLVPGLTRADDRSQLDLDHINLQYNGGPLIEHVRVATLFWGASWRQDQKQRQLSDYMNGFFQDLFADGRF